MYPVYMCWSLRGTNTLMDQRVEYDLCIRIYRSRYQNLDDCWKKAEKKQGQWCWWGMKFGGVNEGGKFGWRMGSMRLGARQVGVGCDCWLINQWNRWFNRVNSCRSRHTDTTQQFQGQAWVGPWNTLQKQKLQVLLVHHLWPVEIHF